MGIARIGSAPEVAVWRLRELDEGETESRLDLSPVAISAARIAWLASSCGLDSDRIENIVRAVATGMDGIVDAVVETDPEGAGLTIGLYEA